jgi:hypothetical protein
MNEDTFRSRDVLEAHSATLEGSSGATPVPQ